ncbi:mycofactocin-coupled SDR family oxidoreductase [Streptomyces sp. NBC_00669]|uniref:mycofactocin-coupled SDR family oxidoreductase n=1 Tax=unclassified Streptomyces TaxID=2593676 RepID=UPI002E1FF21B|nr:MULTISPECIES: mycofactocin-coupled SDR family oxidoreductase [unclassified Streptomyces]
MGRVEGKVAVVTGAARGQGRSHAVRLAEEGADIIAIDACEDNDAATYPMATQADLDETARLVEKAGRRVFARRADVRDAAALRAAIDAGVAELGRLDVVVPNAGILPMGAQLPVGSFTGTIDVNLVGSINTVHAALPHLGEGGSIILVGSIMGFLPPGPEDAMAGPGMGGYKFAKHVMVDYANALANQLAASGRRVNAVHPTNVDTSMLLNDAVYQAFRPDMENPGRADAEPIFTTIQAMPVPYVHAEDVSNAVVYLASDESRYVTGLHLRIDAGALVKQGR